MSLYSYNSTQYETNRHTHIHADRRHGKRHVINIARLWRRGSDEICMCDRTTNATASKSSRRPFRVNCTHSSTDAVKFSAGSSSTIASALKDFDPAVYVHVRVETVRTKSFCMRPLRIGGGEPFVADP